MRILAIRGHNIASLSEPFEIDLAAEPLAGTGLFAITGDTGAGKSTILDTLCLALYGDYPRASTTTREKVADPSGQHLEASDTRNILRRGAGQGYAEVDFIGQDGVGYRARWAVRRARGRADGNPQKPERVLQRLDGGGVVAASLKEVEAAVIGRSGFTFSQFRRAVLLAQGEFDAFLLASEPERAELLEKITGTEVYSAISQQVFEMTSDRQWQLEELERRREAIGVMSEDAGATLAADQQETMKRVAADEAASARLADDLRHADEIGAARASLAQAEATLAEAAADWQAAEADRALAARLAAAEPLAPLAGRLADLRRERCGAEDAAAAAAKGVAEAEATLAGSQGVMTERQRAMQTVEDEIGRSEPLWQRAAALDARVTSAADELSKAERAAEDAALKLREADADRAARGRELAGVEQRLAETRGELAARAAHAPLARDIGRLVRLVGERDAVMRRVTRERGTEETLAREARQVEARLAAGDEAVAARRSERQAQVRELEQQRAELASIDEASLDARFEALGLAREVTRTALEAARRRDAARAAEAAGLSAAAKADGARTMASEQLAAARRAHEHASAGRAEASGILELAEATLSAHAARLRASLVDGEACPVCGACEHPFTHDSGAGAEMARGMKARLAELDEATRRAAAAIVTAEGALAAAEARRAAASSEQASGSAAARAAEDEVGALLPRVRALVAMTAVEPGARLAIAAPDVDALTDLADRLEIARSGLTEPRRRASELRRVCDDLQRRIDEADKATAALEERAAAERVRLPRLHGELARARAVAEELAGHLARLRDEIAPHLVAAAIDVADLDGDAGALRDRLLGLAKDYAALADTAGALDERRGLLGAAVATATAHRDTLAAAARRVELDREARQEAVAKLRMERAGLLGGDETTAHKAGLRDRERAARAAFEDARTGHADASVLLSRRSAEAASAGERSARIAASLAAATAGWSAALAGAGLLEAEARDLLSRPAGQRVALVERLEVLETTRIRAETTLGTRRQDLETRLAAGGDVDAERQAALRSELDGLRMRIDAGKARLAVIANDVARDVAARRQADAISSDITAKRDELAIWQEVNEAIGQKDGAKFRRFAQGVTLGHLVALANEQLLALNARYQLRAGAVSDLAFDVVDRDMGDEVRSPRSLSGGERFLVSLALALALSGLEGRQSFVDTLFIDEGFGSLDRVTLDVAIDALEALQGHGRKVGVITHVPAMMERIAVQIRVEKRGGGRSVVRVHDVAVQPSMRAS